MIRLRILLFALLAVLAGAPFAPGQAQGQDQAPPPQSRVGHFKPDELVQAGHSFFGSISRGLAEAIQDVVSKWGLPNGYILGQEGTGAFAVGLRYGEGTLYTRNAGDMPVFWQGPSLGFDFGGDGARTMMLVYNMRQVTDIFQRFPGIAGSAYLVAGFGITALTADGVTVVPIRSGIGLRLGANVGYLKFTRQPTWNPF
jgi:hypothetical protein